MASEILSIRLTGIAGFSKGKEFSIEEGGTAVVGRSRECNFRLDAKVAPDEQPSEKKPFKGGGGRKEHLLTVSGKHVKIEFPDSKTIFIQDLSKHGTFLNGKKLQGRDQILGLNKGPIEMRLGTNETFRMEFVRTPVKAKPKISVKRRS